MRLGDGHGKGLVRAAANSPALHTCGGPAPVDPLDPVDPVEPVEPTDPTDPGGGGPISEV